jgi:hypothetical protein
MGTGAQAAWCAHRPSRKAPAGGRTDARSCGDHVIFLYLIDLGASANRAGQFRSGASAISLMMITIAIVSITGITSNCGLTKNQTNCGDKVVHVDLLLRYRHQISLQHVVGLSRPKRNMKLPVCTMKSFMQVTVVHVCRPVHLVHLVQTKLKRWGSRRSGWLPG